MIPPQTHTHTISHTHKNTQSLRLLYLERKRLDDVSYNTSEPRLSSLQVGPLQNVFE